MTITNWKIQELTGYVPKTTFYQDFSIADKFGISAIKDTYKRAKSEWQTNTEYLTELVMVLNWKCWEHFERGNEQYARLYQDLFAELDTYAMDTLTGEDLTYFLNTTD